MRDPKGRRSEAKAGRIKPEEAERKRPTGLLKKAAVRDDREEKVSNDLSEETL